MKMLVVHIEENCGAFSVKMHSEPKKNSCEEWSKQRFVQWEEKEIAEGAAVQKEIKNRQRRKKSSEGEEQWKEGFLPCSATYQPCRNYSQHFCILWIWLHNNGRTKLYEAHNCRFAPLSPRLSRCHTYLVGGFLHMNYTAIVITSLFHSFWNKKPAVACSPCRVYRVFALKKSNATSLDSTAFTLLFGHMQRK